MLFDPYRSRRYNLIVDAAFRQHVLANTAWDLTMLQGFFMKPNTIGGYWTLQLELAFYAICILFGILKWRRYAKRTTYAILIVTLVFGVAVPLFFHHRAPMAGLFSIGTFFVGTLFFESFTKKISRKDFLETLSLFGAVMAVATFINYSMFPRGDSEQHSVFAVVAPWIAAYATFYALLRRADSDFHGFFNYLGNISYSTYLLHPIVMCLVPDTLVAPAAFVTAISGTIFLSTMTYYWLEVPAIETCRRITRSFAVNATR